MPLWTFKCDTCSRVEDRWFTSFDEMREKEQRYSSCKPSLKGCRGKMVREVSAAAFTVEGYNANNGYAKEGG